MICFYFHRQQQKLIPIFVIMMISRIMFHRPCRCYTVTTTKMNLCVTAAFTIQPTKTNNRRRRCSSRSSFPLFVQRNENNKQTTTPPPPSRTKIITASEQVVQDMLERIRDCNNVPEHILKESIPFIVNNIQYGIVRPKIAHLLCSIHVEIPIQTNNTTTITDSGGSYYKGPIFTMQMPKDNNDENNNNNNNNKDNKNIISLSTTKAFLTFVPNAVGTTYETRTAAVHAVMWKLYNHKEQNTLNNQRIVTGWRNELLPIQHTFYDNEPLFGMERSAVPLIGAIEYGVHVNGIVHVPVNDDGSDATIQEGESGSLVYETKMWLARRSQTKSKYPGMVDHIVAGGQPVGISLYDNVIKECMEEAGISKEYIQQKASLLPVSAISYSSYNPIKDVIQRAVLFNYDLFLPMDFVPTPVDGEVDEFFVWSMEQLYDSMSMSYPDPIKPNCYLVIIDYFLRHGYVTPDTPGYLNLVNELRSGLCQ